MITVIYTMLSAALKRCFAALNLVVIMGMFALFATSCRSSSYARTMDETTVAQSTIQRTTADTAAQETLILTKERVRADSANLSLSMESLRDIPPDAGYFVRHGRLTLSVRKRANAPPGKPDLLISAYTDSIDREVSFLANKTQQRSIVDMYRNSSQKQISAKEKKVKKTPPGSMFLVAILLLILVLEWKSIKRFILQLK